MSIGHCEWAWDEIVSLFKSVRVMSLYSLGLRISSNVLQGFLKKTLRQNMSWASLGLFHKAEFCGCFHHSWTFINQEIQNHFFLLLSYQTVTRLWLSQVLSHFSVFSFWKLLHGCYYRRHLESHYHFVSGYIYIRKTETCTCHRCASQHW